MIKYGRLLFLLLFIGTVSAYATDSDCDSILPLPEIRPRLQHMLDHAPKNSRIEIELWFKTHKYTQLIDPDTNKLKMALSKNGKLMTNQDFLALIQKLKDHDLLFTRKLTIKSFQYFAIPTPLGKVIIEGAIADITTFLSKPFSGLFQAGIANDILRGEQ